MQATLYYVLRKKDTMDTCSFHFQDASGLALPAVGETVETPLGEYVVHSRSYQYENDHMSVTLTVDEV